MRALSSLFSLLNQGVRNVLHYNQQHHDFPMTQDQIEAYVPKFLIHSLVWCMSGDGKMSSRQEVSDYIRNITTIPLPSPSNSLIIDFEVNMQGEWVPWSNKVPQIEIETHKVASPDVVVPTLDTVRHESLLYTWLADHKPLVLCGPPGSGKTMTLFAALRALPDMEVRLCQCFYVYQHHLFCYDIKICNNVFSTLSGPLRALSLTLILVTGSKTML